MLNKIQRKYNLRKNAKITSGCLSELFQESQLQYQAIPNHRHFSRMII